MTLKNLKIAYSKKQKIYFGKNRVTSINFDKYEHEFNRIPIKTNYGLLYFWAGLESIKTDIHKNKKK